MSIPLAPCSLSPGTGVDLCSDAAVGDGPARPALPGAFHLDNLRRGCGLQGGDEAVLDGNNIRGEKSGV